MEFPTQEALKKYLDEHPDADKTKHKVEDVGKVQKKRKSIYDDTPVMPEIVGDSVASKIVNKVWDKLDKKEQEELDGFLNREFTDQLADKAEKMYKKDDAFAKIMQSKGNRGRDYLHGLMEKWVLDGLKDKKPQLWEKIPK
jgi:hypothetical protein